MMKKINQITVFISCPGEVDNERKIVQDVCKRMSNVLQRSRKLSIRSIFWKDDILFEITGNGAQNQINNFLDEIDYDIYIGILWKYFGEKQLNGYTPTEEEFEIALQKRKNSRRPRIKFFFKQNGKKKNCIDFEETSKFQARVRNEGLADDFQSDTIFQGSVNEFILDVIENLDYLPRIKNDRKFNTKFEKEYIQRKIIDYSTYHSTSYQYFGNENLQNLKSIIKSKQKIILLGDAGIGKSKELKNVEYQFSKNDSSLFPVLINLNKYGANELTSLFLDDWDEIPKNQLLLLMDGFDEVESKYRNDLIKQIELFCDKYPESRIVIASRTNFYNSEDKNDAKVGTLKYFESYVLIKLSYEQYQEYAEEHIKKNSKMFWEIISLNKMHDLLGIPFYLVYLVNRFNSEGNLPNSRSEIFEDIIRSRIVFDEEHYRLKLGEEQLPDRNKILKELERVALAMEMLGRNHLTNDEYMIIVPQKETRELLKHKVLFNKKNSNWEFEHQSFQEYLAAKFLSDKSYQKTKLLYTFKPDYKKIIPSWTNTLSFLLSMSNDESFKKWIINNEPELTIKFELDRLPEKTRVIMFKKVFKDYKQKRNWINYQKYRFIELAKFGQSKTIVVFLLNQFKQENHYTTWGNAINLLGYMDIPSELGSKVRNKLLKIAITYNNPTIQNDAMMALSALKFNSKKVVDTLVNEFQNSENDWIRYGLYSLLNDSKYVSENVKLYLDGIAYVRSRFSNKGESRLGNETWELERGLSKITDTQAIKSILRYFISNPRDLEYYGIKKVAEKIWSNVITAFQEDNSIFDLMFELFFALRKEYLENEVKQLHIFFNKTNTNTIAFKKIYNESKTNGYEYLHYLGYFLSEGSFDFIIEKYQAGLFSESDMWGIISIVSLENENNYEVFVDFINKQTNNKFRPKPNQNFEEERENRHTREAKLLFNKEAFLKEVQLIYHDEGKKSLSKSDIKEIQKKAYIEKKHLHVVIDEIKNLSTQERITFNQVKTKTTTQKWENWSISTIYNYLNNDKKFEASEFHISKVERWCKKNINKVDFNTALVQVGKTYSTSWIAVFLSYFLRKFKLKYPKKVLLDMLSFDWDNKGIFYLLDFLEINDIKNRIRYNLKCKKLNNHELINYLNFAKEYEIKELKEFSVLIVEDSNKDSELRELALDIINSVDRIEQILITITDEFKWDVIDWLVERGSELSEQFLLNLLKIGSENDKLKSALVLLKLENIEGLNFYTKHLEMTKEYYSDRALSNPFVAIKNIEALPYILRLLKLSYLPILNEKKIDTLYGSTTSVLTKMALVNEENFILVKSEIEKFIKKNQSELVDVYFLYSFIESLEHQYYLNKSVKPSIDNVAEVLNLLEKS